MSDRYTDVPFDFFKQVMQGKVESSDDFEVVCQPKPQTTFKVCRHGIDSRCICTKQIAYTQQQANAMYAKLN